MSEIRKIQLLPPEIVHRIAAGEVVDKPASILKELVENSIDAQAKKVHVTFVDGGIRSIQVDDDGYGLSREDLEACIQRHATSKIHSIEDLDAIPLLGFRGEALSAAASVCRLTIDTSRKSDGAWILRVTGGVREAVRPGSRKRGTRVTIEDLFFNVPARRKFLRKPGLEAQDCIETLEALALSHPEVEFAWSAVDEKGELRDQRHLPAGTLVERFRALVSSTADLTGAVADDPAPGVKKIQVALFKPPAASQTLKSIRLSVNGRPVADKRLPYIVREAFSGLIEVGRFPYAHIAVEIDPSLIDVNIHPQKKEIRWSNGFSPGSVAYGLIRKALAEHQVPAPIAESSESALPAAVSSARRNLVAPAPSSKESLNLFAAPAMASASRSESESGLEIGSSASFLSSVATRSGTSSLQAPQTTRPPFRFNELRIVGEAAASWILCESPEGLIVIDQHAAHERVNFEKQLKRLNLLRAKPLFLPIRIKLPYLMKGLEDDLQKSLETLSFELAERDTLPSGEIEIIAVPESERRLDWELLLKEVMAELAEGERADRIADRLKVKVAASLACHGSVRRGQRLGNDEIRALLTDLDLIEWGGLCPHGRPVWFLMANSHIESLFHR